MTGGLSAVFCRYSDERARTIELYGVKTSVEQTKQSVLNILQHLPSSSSDLRHIKQNCNRNDYLKAFCNSSDVPAPDHWKVYTDRLNDIGTAKPQLTPVDGRLEQAVISLVTSTWDKTLVGQGHDARALQHQNIRVRKVWAVENVQLHKTYVVLIKELYKQKSGRVPPFKGLVGESEIKTVEKSTYFSFLYAVGLSINTRTWQKYIV